MPQDKEPRVSFNRGRRAKRSKFGSVTHIILLLAGLAVIVWLILYLRETGLSETGEEGTVITHASSGLDISENLINYYDEGIQLMRPDTNWAFQTGAVLRHDAADDFSKVMWLNATEIARLSRYDGERLVVNVRVGKLKLAEGESRISRSIAEQSFGEILFYALNPAHPYTVDTLVPTSPMNSGDLKGTYYALTVTHSDNTQRDVRVLSFFIRDDEVFVLMGELDYEEYDYWRTDVEFIFSHFLFV